MKSYSFIWTVLLLTQLNFCAEEASLAPRLELRNAIEADNVQRVQELLSQGVDPNSNVSLIPNTYMHPLIKVIRKEDRDARGKDLPNKNIELITVLMSCPGIDVNRLSHYWTTFDHEDSPLRHNNQGTSLHAAILFNGVYTHNKLSTITLLLENSNVDVNKCTSNGLAPLHLLSAGATNVLRLLLNHPKIDLLIKNQKGKSVLDIAWDQLTEADYLPVFLRFAPEMLKQQQVLMIKESRLVKTLPKALEELLLEFTGLTPTCSTISVTVEERTLSLRRHKEGADAYYSFVSFKDKPKQNLPSTKRGLPAIIYISGQQYIFDNTTTFLYIPKDILEDEERRVKFLTVCKPQPLSSMKEE